MPMPRAFSVKIESSKTLNLFVLMQTGRKIANALLLDVLALWFIRAPIAPEPSRWRCVLRNETIERARSHVYLGAD